MEGPFEQHEGGLKNISEAVVELAVVHAGQDDGAIEVPGGDAVDEYGGG